MSNNIEEDIEIVNAIVKVNKDYLKDVENQTINQREIQAIENILADRERLEKENEENRISILMYRNLRKCFQDMVKEILGEDYYNMGMDTYTCDKLACEDIINKKVKIMFKGKDKDLQAKANKYDTLVEMIKSKLEEINSFKMDIVTSPIHNRNEKLEMLKRNQVKKEIFQELLEEGEKE